MYTVTRDLEKYIGLYMCLLTSLRYYSQTANFPESLWMWIIRCCLGVRILDDCNQYL